MTCEHVFPSLNRYLTGTLIHKSRLCTIGGSGLNIVPETSDDKQPQDAGAQYEQTFSRGVGYGLNNEYYEFDMESGKSPFSVFVQMFE